MEILQSWSSGLPYFCDQKACNPYNLGENDELETLVGPTSLGLTFFSSSIHFWLRTIQPLSLCVNNNCSPMASWYNGKYWTIYNAEISYISYCPVCENSPGNKTEITIIFGWNCHQALNRMNYIEIITKHHTIDFELVKSQEFVQWAFQPWWRCTQFCSAKASESLGKTLSNKSSQFPKCYANESLSFYL